MLIKQGKKNAKFEIFFQVPGAEGRAGMAAIVDPEGILDLKAVAEGLKKALPSYACPLFIRVLKEIDVTGE